MTDGVFEKELLRLATAPALALWRGARKRSVERGVVLFYHGFTVDKEAQLPELKALAAAGYLAIGVDAAGHGERRLADFDQHFGGSDHRQRMFKLVAETVAELPAVVDALEDVGIVQAGRLAIGGVSMGGHICYGAAVIEPRISVVTPILGSPCWPRPDSPHLQPERFFPKAVLSQNAGNDTIVSPGGARALHNDLTRVYGEDSARLRYVEFPESEHEMREEDWRSARNNLVQWLGVHLR
jgi:alpha-beta hydrolase superfamily lysophospholipase